MTEHLPDEITYGFVADRVLLAVGDTTGDDDRFPDGVPAKGTITFTPERDTHYTQQTPATVLQQPIECTIYQGDPDDGEGTEDPKRIGLLVDPAGHVGNVALVVGWYSVSYRLERGAAKRFRFQVLPEHTADEPLWLSSVAPLTPSPSERFVVNEKVYNDTLAARDQTEQYRDKTKEYRDQAQTARTGAETAETNAKTHATDAASSASSAADVLAATEALGITVDTSAGTKISIGDTAVYYNSGWRTFPISVPGYPAATEVVLRRTLDKVDVYFYANSSIDSSVADVTDLFDLPQGFRTAEGRTALPAFNPYSGQPLRNVNNGLYVIRDTVKLYIYSTTYRVATSDSFSAEESLPTSLPGTPA